MTFRCLLRHKRNHNLRLHLRRVSLVGASPFASDFAAGFCSCTNSWCRRLATELPTGVFTPAELREARPYMKSNKVTRTDEVPNEIIRILLEDAIGFLLILEKLTFLYDQLHSVHTVPAL